MKKLLLGSISLRILLGLFILSQSTGCAKKADDKNDSGDITNISNVSGTYKNGTLEWSKTVSYSSSDDIKGTDPNFTFTVTYLGNDKCRLLITTIAPIAIKSYDLPLVSKNMPFPIVNGGGVITYTFANNEMGVGVELTKGSNATPIVARGAISYTPASYAIGNISFWGNGTR